MVRWEKEWDLKRFTRYLTWFMVVGFPVIYLLFGRYLDYVSDGQFFLDPSPTDYFFSLFEWIVFISLPILMCVVRYEKDFAPSAKVKQGVVSILYGTVLAVVSYIWLVLAMGIGAVIESMF